MRGGGRRKDKKKSKAEKKQAARTRTVEQKFAEEVAIQGCDRETVVRMIEENEENRKVMVQMLEENDDDRKMIESMSEGSDAEMEQQLQNFRTACREVLEWNQEQVEVMQHGLRWAVEARRKGRGEEQEQRRQDEQEQRRQGEPGRNSGQKQSKQDKEVRFDEEEQ